MPHSSQPSARILIVEDNELDALLLQEALKKAAHEAAHIKLELVVAGQVCEAIRMLDESWFDVVLADLSLPDGQGLQTFNRLHAHTPVTPIIVLTGFQSEEASADTIRAGAQDYIVKGTMNEKALWRVISFAIERHSLEKILRESEQRYQLLFDSVTDYVYTVKVQNGRATATTHRPGCIRVTGYSPEDFDRDPDLWYRMVHEGDRIEVLKQAVRVLAGDPTPLDHRITTKCGSLRWVRHTPIPRHDAKNRLIGYDGVIADITELKLPSETEECEPESS